MKLAPKSWLKLFLLPLLSCQLVTLPLPSVTIVVPSFASSHTAAPATGASHGGQAARLLVFAGRVNLQVGEAHHAIAALPCQYCNSSFPPAGRSPHSGSPSHSGVRRQPGSSWDCQIDPPSSAPLLAAQRENHWSPDPVGCGPDQLRQGAGRHRQRAGSAR